MKIKMQAVLFLSLVTIITGCTSARIEGTGIPSEKSQNKVIHGSFYGYQWCGPRTITQNADLHRVITHTNMLYSLAAVGTLGIYVPQEIEWWTVAPIPPNYSGEVMKPKTKDNLTILEK